MQRWGDTNHNWMRYKCIIVPRLQLYILFYIILEMRKKTFVLEDSLKTNNGGVGKTQRDIPFQREANLSALIIYT